MSDYGSSITLARLYERVSKKGNTYLSGRLGMATIVLFKTDEVSESGQPIWLLKLSEPAPKPNATTRDEAKRDWQKPAREQPNAYSEATRGASFKLQPASSAGIGLNDEIPFAPEVR